MSKPPRSANRQELDLRVGTNRLARALMACLLSSACFLLSAGEPAHPQRMDAAKRADWQQRWERNIMADARNRYCDKELGEEIGWLMTPFLDGFYYGYMATKDPKWAANLVDWTDAWIKRAVREPDGCVGWPKTGAAGTKVDNLDDFSADSLLGEAMVLRPIVLLAAEILQSPVLKAKHGPKAEGYLKLAEQVFEKWDRRGAWRDTQDGGMIPVVLPFGIDSRTGQWTAGFGQRNEPGHGFSHPDNKANAVAQWLLAMFDATRKPIYQEHAAKWFRVMKSRMKVKDGARYEIWNYWQPAGAWDYKPDGSPKHWVGTHPNRGYYEVDVQGIVAAYEHGLVFTKDDIDRLVATALAEKRYWTALVPYSPAIQKEFETNHKPDSWGGLGSTPWFLMLQTRLESERH